jgi:hypothetical protein
MTDQDQFDPREMLATLSRNYVSFVVIGGLARVIRGTDELTDGVDICPSLQQGNLERLSEALEELDARRTDRQRLSLGADVLSGESVIRLRTTCGELKLVPEPEGTRRGYDDLRRGASREHLGQGLRPEVASVADLARMAAALGREQDLVRSRELRRILEVEHTLQRTLGRGLEL